MTEGVESDQLSMSHSPSSSLPEHETGVVIREVSEHATTADISDAKVIDDHIDEETGRADWEPLHSIPHSKFHQILAQHIEDNTDHGSTTYKFVGSFQGSFHYVRIYTLRSGPHAEPYVVKVPGVGTAARWQKQDAYMLRSEYGTMKLIRERTDCPIPEVLAYDDTLENALGAPFIIMKACPGVPANQIWFDPTNDNKDDEGNVDSPLVERAAMRKNFLESLARAMSELHVLDFDKIGALDFENPRTDLSYRVGPCWHENTVGFTKTDLRTDRVLKEQPVCESSHDFFISAFNTKHPNHTLKAGPETANNQILEALFRCHPFASSVRSSETKETFVLRHDDLSFQNILCDPETGKVTAIIDWDRCVTAPRCIGFASLPNFLISDWFPLSAYPVASSQRLLLDDHRRAYARAMLSATGTLGDGQYTFKSALYQAAYTAIYGSSAGSSDLGHFIRKFLGEIPNLAHVHQKSWLTWSENDWAKYVEHVKGELPTFVAPEDMGAV